MAPRDLAHLLLGQPDLAEQYMRALGLKGGLPSYSGAEFEPSITVLDLTAEEFLNLRRIQRFYRGIRLAAVAGQLSQCAYRPYDNAPRSIITTERLWISNPTAAPYDVQIGFGNPGTTVPNPGATPIASLDDRSWPFGAACASQLYPVNVTSATPIAAATADLTVRVPANTGIQIPFVCVMTARVLTATPNVGMLFVECLTANAAMDVGLEWRERTAIAPELT